MASIIWRSGGSVAAYLAAYRRMWRRNHHGIGGSGVWRRRKYRNNGESGVAISRNGGSESLASKISAWHQRSWESGENQKVSLKKCRKRA
jgi:hypothetical protein